MMNDIVKDIVKEWTDKMDDVFIKYRDNNHPPCQITDDDEALAICLGMGIADFKAKDGGYVLETTSPVAIHWTGEKFEIYQKRADHKKENRDKFGGRTI